MDSVRNRLIAVGAVAVLLAACGTGEHGNPNGSSSGGSSSADLLGAGPTFLDPVYQEWIGEFTKAENTDVSISAATSWPISATSCAPH